MKYLQIGAGLAISLLALYFACQGEDVGRVEALSTIVVERVVDTLGVIILLVAATLLLHIAGIAGRPVLLLSGALALLLAALWLMTSRRSDALRIAGWLTRAL